MNSSKFGRKKFLQGAALLGLSSGVAGGTTRAQSQGQSSGDFTNTLLNRRSKRFARGMKTDEGPLAYQSRSTVEPLSNYENAYLAFCGAGMTGYARGDFVYTRKDEGQMMSNFASRCYPSPDGANTSVLFGTNERETFMMKRPVDMNIDEIDDLIDLAKQRRFEEIYRRQKVVLNPTKSTPPLQPPYNLPINQSHLYQPGTTYLLPVMDSTFLYIVALLTNFDPKMGIYVLDERRNYRSAGLRKYRKSRGGHLVDNANSTHTLTIERLENMVDKAVNVESGTCIQSMLLGATHLGLGAYPNFAAHPNTWFKALGFRMETMKISRFSGARSVQGFFTELTGQNDDFEFPVGLELGGFPVLKPYAPPYYSMDDAVDAVIERKFGANGTYGKRFQASAFKNANAMGSYVRKCLRPDPRSIAATKDYCNYIVDTYGRFPAYSPAWQTTLGVQAAHVDQSFYHRFYNDT